MTLFPREKKWPHFPHTRFLHTCITEYREVCDSVEKPESFVAMFTHTTADKHAHAKPHQSRKRLASPIYRGARRFEQAGEGGGALACDGGPHKEMSSERVRGSRGATIDPTCGCQAAHVCSDWGPTPLLVGEHQLYINLRPIPIPSIQPPHLTLSRRPRHRILLLSVGHLRRRRPPTLFWFSSAQQSCPPPPRKYARASSATAAVLGAQTHPRLSG